MFRREKRPIYITVYSVLFMYLLAMALILLPACLRRSSPFLQEDAEVIRLVTLYGAKKWSAVAEYLPGRVGKQCRER